MVPTSLWIEGAKEPQPIFLERATGIETRIDFREAVGSCSRKRKVFRSRNHPFGREVSKHVTVQLIPAALGKHLENSASREPIFSAERTRLDFNLLNKLKWQIRARSTERRIS